MVQERADAHSANSAARRLKGGKRSAIEMTDGEINEMEEKMSEEEGLVQIEKVKRNV